MRTLRASLLWRRPSQASLDFRDAERYHSNANMALNRVQFVTSYAGYIRLYTEMAGSRRS
jgi:hypothetical protein